MLITLDEAKQYLRVDTASEDDLITSLLGSAEKICRDVARLEESETPTETETLKVAVLYTLAYLYEHREEADHKDLMLTLRALLSADRKSQF